MRKLKYTFKTDTLFKMLFVRYPDLLRMLVAALLHIPVESIEEFAVQNPEIIPENLGDKFCRLDINMIVNGQLVDLEIQVNNEGSFEDRTLLYWARDFSAALPAGQSYDKLPRTIVIIANDINKLILMLCVIYVILSLGGIAYEHSQVQYKSRNFVGTGKSHNVVNR